jgi:hypothetical protein
MKGRIATKGWLAAVLWLCACSGSGSTTPTGQEMGGSSGLSGGGGTAGAAALPGQGAISLQIGGPSSTCPEPGQVYPVGKPAPSATDPGQSVVDGVGDTNISCSVRGTGPYTFSGSLHATSSDGNRDPITVTFSNGVIDANRTTGTATVTVFTPQLSASFASGSTPCTVEVINQQVKGGSIWANFSCPSLTSPPSGACASGVAPSVSTFVFENCDGS